MTGLTGTPLHIANVKISPRHFSTTRLLSKLVISQLKRCDVQPEPGVASDSKVRAFDMSDFEEEEEGP
jgi:hypothetical protein